MQLHLQVDVAKQAYHQAEAMEEDEDDEDDDDEEEKTNPRDVGHNIYILAHQASYLPLTIVAGK